MHSYVAELLDYLDLYKVLLENHFYAENGSNKASELIKMIDLLSIAHKNNNLTSYDYKELKKKIAVLFHPDINTITIPKEYNINMLELISKTNGILDSIEKEIGKKNSFDYNEAEPFSTAYERRYEDYTHNDYYYDNNPFEKDEEYVRKEQEKEKRKAKFDQRIESLKNGIIKTKDYICLISKERFNAMFRDIPSNSNDYYNIKKRFESTLSNLTSRVNVLQTTLMILKSNMSNLNNKYQMDSSNFSIERYYNNLLNESQRYLINKRNEYNNADNIYKQIKYKYSKEYNEMINYWIRTTSEIVTDIINVNNEINEKIFYKGNEKELSLLKKRLKKLNKEREEYLSYEELKVKAVEYLKNNHPDYKEAVEKYNKAQEEYNRANINYLYYYKHKKKIQEEYLENVYKEYKNKYMILDLRIKSSENKRDRIARTIYTTNTRYNEFIDNYASIYDNEYNNEETHSSRK